MGNQSVKNKRTCKYRHTYYKSSDCDVCPICEKEKKPAGGFLSLVSAPARRALEGAGIKTLNQLSKYSGKELLKLHGIGPTAIPKLRAALKEENLSFKR